MYQFYRKFVFGKNVLPPFGGPLICAQYLLRIHLLRETMVVLNQTIRQLQLTIAELLSGGDQQGPAKNSGMSLPPSSDIVPRTKSRRRPSGKKNGGPTGHEGWNLKFSTEPDFMEDIVPEACVACGADLSAQPGTLAACREVIEYSACAPCYYPV